MPFHRSAPRRLSLPFRRFRLRCSSIACLCYSTANPFNRSVLLRFSIAYHANAFPPLCSANYSMAKLCSAMPSRLSAIPSLCYQRDSMAQLILSFAKRMLAVPSRCVPPQFSSILSNSSAAHAYSIPFQSQSFMYHADLLPRWSRLVRADPLRIRSDDLPCEPPLA